MRYKKCVRGYVFMTNKQNKQLLEDQAFIDSVYKSLADDNALYTDDELPSELLDKRILSAAHKAVETSPILEEDQLSNKRKSWFFPMATAASVLLMLTVVQQQINLTYFSDGTQTTEMTSSMPELAMSDSIETNNQELEAQFMAGQIKEKQYAAAQAKKEVAASIQSKPSLARTKQSKSFNITTDDTSSDLLKINEKTPVIELTVEQYLLLKKDAEVTPLYWRLIAIQENSYLIQFQSSELKNVTYRLNKSRFKIDNTNRVETRLFSEIQQ